MGRTTIAAHVALSTTKVPVGRGQWKTPQISLGWSENKQSKKKKKNR
jgi:hypothetical protein